MTPSPKALTRAEVAHLYDFIEELEALIDADDGTCFSCQHIDKLDVIKEILGYSGESDESE